MIADQLKKAVLQAAIQGKLTEQLPEDGDAHELLDEIKAEKGRLIKEGKNKKEKTLPEITEDEMPFDIPDNWCWVRLGEIIFNRGMKKPNTEFTYIDISSIDNRKNQLGDLSNILLPEKAPSRARKMVNLGDVIYATVRPYLHNICMIDRIIDPEPIVSTGFAVVSSTNVITNKFLFWCLLTPMFDYYANDNENAKGVAYPAINNRKFLNATIPLPPLAEQQRIVEKIEEIFPEIESLSVDENRLDILQQSFPGQMKSSILQAAIQGKLTEQLPEDGDAHNLLVEIKAEKEQLIKEGKIKKGKSLSDIKEDEIPFDIPNNWCWVRLGEFLKITNGFTPLRSNYSFWNSKDIPWLTIADIREQGHIINRTKEFISKKAVSNWDRVVPANSVLLCCTASIGEYAITNIDLTTNQQFNGLTIKKEFSDLIIPDFLFFYVQTLASKLKDEAGKTTFPFLSTKKLSEFIIPLPPLAEQHRIVARLEELLPLCDTLE